MTAPRGKQTAQTPGGCSGRAQLPWRRQSPPGTGRGAHSAVRRGAWGTGGRWPEPGRTAGTTGRAAAAEGGMGCEGREGSARSVVWVSRRREGVRQAVSRGAVGGQGLKRFFWKVQLEARGEEAKRDRTQGPARGRPFACSSGTCPLPPVGSGVPPGAEHPGSRQRDPQCGRCARACHGGRRGHRADPGHSQEAAVTIPTGGGGRGGGDSGQRLELTAFAGGSIRVDRGENQGRLRGFSPERLSSCGGHRVGQKPSFPAGS